MARPKGSTEFRGVGTAELQRMVNERMGLPRGLDPIPLWLRPPRALDKISRKRWRDAVYSRGIEWFQRADVDLLRMYVNAWRAVDVASAQVDKAPGQRESLQHLSVATGILGRFMRVLGLGIVSRVTEAYRLRATSFENQTEKMADHAVQNLGDDLLQAAHGAHVAKETPDPPVSDIGDQAASEGWVQ
jgi:hypothetical protein